MPRPASQVTIPAKADCNEACRKLPLIPYLILFGFFAVAAFAAGTRPHGQIRPAFLVGGLILILMIGLRNDVGGDWPSYGRIFHHIQLGRFSASLTSIDPAYGIINWVAAQAGFGVWAVNLVCAMLFTIGLIRLCHDQPNPQLALLVSIPYLVIVVAMGYTRQAAALGMVMLALSQYSRGDMMRMVISLIAAAAFHKSAIVVLPLFAAASSRDRLLTFLLLIVVGLLAYYQFFYSGFDRLMANYIDASRSSSGAAIRIAMNVLPAAIFLGFSRHFGFDRNQRRLWMLFSFASFVALVFLIYSPSSTAVDRTSLFLIPLQVVVLSRLPIAFGTSSRQSLVVVTGIIAYSLAVELIWLNIGDNAHAWIPYRNYIWDWNQSQIGKR